MGPLALTVLTVKVTLVFGVLHTSKCFKGSAKEKGHFGDCSRHQRWASLPS